MLAMLPILFFSDCYSTEDKFVHEITFEENAYVRGTTSDAGYVNLLENQDYVANKGSIKEITGVKIQYRVTRNGTPTDITVNFYFGENKADVFLGSAFLAQGETHSEFQNLSMENSYYQMIDLIMRKDAFWYSIQGNTKSADVDIEPVRITIYGTFKTFLR